MSEEILITHELTKRYPGLVKPAVDNLSLKLYSGEVYALVGESGCGKTTALRMIAGLETPDSGSIYLHESEMFGPHKNVPAERRRIGMVFQNSTLFPHLTVLKNISFGLTGPKRSRRSTAMGYLHTVGLPETAGFYPHQLSGGQQQRIALARALAVQPDLILLDEPFSSLDVRIKERVIDQMRDILEETGLTALLVTHDIKEAFQLADRIGVMMGGRVLQEGSAPDIYSHPKTGYVADFLGPANSLPSEIFSSLFNSAESKKKLGLLKKGEEILFRPEEMLLSSPEVGEQANAEVKRVIYMGDRMEYILSIGDYAVKAAEYNRPLRTRGEQLIVRVVKK